MAKKHKNILPECIEMFKNVNYKLDQLIERADKINGRYEKHIDESSKYRKSVDRHDHILDLMEKEKYNTSKNAQWRVGLIVGVVMGLLTLASKLFIGG